MTGKVEITNLFLCAYRVFDNHFVFAPKENIGGDHKFSVETYKEKYISSYFNSPVIPKLCQVNG